MTPTSSQMTGNKKDSMRTSKTHFLNMSKKIETDEKGIPIKGPLPEGRPPVSVTFTIMTVIVTCIGGTITYFTIVKGNDNATEKLELLARYDLGYLYVAILLLKLGQFLMGLIF